MLEQANKTKRVFGLISLLVLLIAFFSIWIAIISSTDKTLQVTFFNVGQGDSAFIEFPDGKNALVDGGPDKSVLEKLGQKIPFYKRKIDIIFLSHPHADHLTGLIYVLKRYNVGRVVITGATHTSPEYEEFIRLVQEKNIPVTKAVYGTRFDFGNNVKAEILYPNNITGVENLNDTSEVLFLKYNEESFLFMGDLEKDATNSMLTLNHALKTNVIKVPHHGSHDAFNKNLYEQTGVKYAVISVGENKYGHPYSSLLDFLEKSGIKTLRTDKSGDIEFISDGNDIKIKN